MNIQAFLILILLGVSFSGCATPPNQTKENAPVATGTPDPSDTPANVKSPSSDATLVSESSEKPVLLGADAPEKEEPTKQEAPAVSKPPADEISPEKVPVISAPKPEVPVSEKQQKQETSPAKVEKPAPVVQPAPVVKPTPPTPKPEAFSHSIWNELLKKHVNTSGKVNYKGFIQDKAKHQSYLDLLSKNPPQSTWKRNEKLAFWINAYNAFTVKLITDNYPLKSITDLGKPWDKAFINIGGKTYTLNQVENEIIRPRFNEPRIHFAVNCAAKSCPPLLNTAFLPETLNAQLEKTTRAFIRNPSSNQISEKSASLSKIFDWYGEDFTKSGSLIDYINQYSTAKAGANAKVSFKEYDWGLNE